MYSKYKHFEDESPDFEDISEDNFVTVDDEDLQDLEILDLENMEDLQEPSDKQLDRTSTAGDDSLHLDPSHSSKTAWRPSPLSFEYGEAYA